MKIRLLCALLAALFLIAMGGLTAPVQAQSSVTLLLRDVVIKDQSGRAES